MVAETLQEISQASVPGTYCVDFIPILKYVPAWVPGAGFQRVAQEYKILGQKLRNEPFEATEQHMVRNSCDLH